MAAFSTTVGFVEEPELGNKGLVITVKTDGEIIGHLMVGKASLHWFEKNAKKNANKATWDELIQWIKQRPSVKTSRPWSCQPSLSEHPEQLGAWERPNKQMELTAPRVGRPGTEKWRRPPPRYAYD